MPMCFEEVLCRGRTYVKVFQSMFPKIYYHRSSMEDKNLKQWGNPGRQAMFFISCVLGMLPMYTLWEINSALEYSNMLNSPKYNYLTIVHIKRFQSVDTCTYTCTWFQYIRYVESPHNFNIFSGSATKLFIAAFSLWYPDLSNETT